MRGRTLDLNNDLDETQAVTPESHVSPERRTGKETLDSAAFESSMTSSGNRMSELEIVEDCHLEEGPMSEKR
jgi:hypothetical protein